jgi:rare lipoprotein A
MTDEPRLNLFNLPVATRLDGRIPSGTGWIRLCLTLAVLMLAGCSGSRWDAPTQPGSNKTSAQPGEARSSRGNPPFYEVYGERYYVMDSSAGYKEQGVASWYGKKFHGNPTSSGERYDMYTMTAAHKTLPLPTTVRVTNLRNGKSVVVRVNDRGPFIDNRLIDMSYAAARELDMIGSGTTLVEVVVLNSQSPSSSAYTSLQPAPAGGTGLNPVSSAVAEPVNAPAPVINLYLQVGAFGDRLNAQQLEQKLINSGIVNVVIRYDASSEPALYRVRLGPIADVDEFDALVARMAGLNISNTHLVTERPDATISATTSNPDPGG